MKRSNTAEPDCLGGIIASVLLGVLLFSVLLAGTGPTPDEHMRMMDRRTVCQRPDRCTVSSGVTWR